MHPKDFKHTGLSFTQDSIIDKDIISFWNDFSDDAATVICYTSGSTGIPKQIEVEKSAMLYSAKNTVAFFGLHEDSLGLHCLPSKYIAGRMMLVRAFISGMKLHVVPASLNPLKNIRQTEIDFAAFTPAQVLEILGDTNTAAIFSKIKYVIIGGAAIDAELEKRLLSFNNHVYATYGMTETVSHIALRKLGEASYQKLSTQTTIGVDDESCLWIKDASFSQDVLQTNDVVHLLDEDHFEWLGRRDFVINSGGVKLHPEQIENKIRSLEQWLHIPFFITRTNDIRFGERPLLVVLKKGEIPSLASLSDVLNKTEMPQQIVEAPEFIYTESGKLNRVETVKLLK